MFFTFLFVLEDRDEHFLLKVKLIVHFWGLLITTRTHTLNPRFLQFTLFQL